MVLPFNEPKSTIIWQIWQIQLYYPDFGIYGMNKSDTTTQVKVDVTFDCTHNTGLSIKKESTFPPLSNWNTVKIHIKSMAHCLLV